MAINQYIITFSRLFVGPHFTRTSEHEFLRRNIQPLVSKDVRTIKESLLRKNSKKSNPSKLKETSNRRPLQNITESNNTAKQKLRNPFLEPKAIDTNLI